MTVPTPVDVKATLAIILADFMQNELDYLHAFLGNSQFSISELGIRDLFEGQDDG
ncbi:MAG: hypothetical protein KUG74_17280 [Rhodobacteraceae bacterium]|nr:hypothetical protein [Paracoccaceae bacterium]